MSDKWCFYCDTDSHSDRECWSTRAKPWFINSDAVIKRVNHLESALAERDARIAGLEQVVGERDVLIESLSVEIKELKQKLAAASSQIDALMLEFCPEDMTQE